MTDSVKTAREFFIRLFDEGFMLKHFDEMVAQDQTICCSVFEAFANQRGVSQHSCHVTEEGQLVEPCDACVREKSLSGVTQEQAERAAKEIGEVFGLQAEAEDVASIIQCECNK
jgi:hypothetical protein